MRIPRHELLNLLGASNPEAPRGAAPAAGDTLESPVTPAPTLAGHGPSPACAVIARALPGLWRYAQAQPGAHEPRLVRRKLRELLSWVLTKEGYRLEPHAPTPYRMKGRTIKGRLELLARNAQGDAVLALETDWTSETESLLKLEVWHTRAVPTLWVVGRPCMITSLAEYRTRANRTLQGAGWLPIFHVDHGWVHHHGPRTRS